MRQENKKLDYVVCNSDDDHDDHDDDHDDHDDHDYHDDYDDNHDDHDHDHDDHDGYHDDQNYGFDLFVDDKYLKKDSTVTQPSKKIATTSSSQFNVPLRGLL